MDREALEQRTKKFALRVIKLVEALPHTITGQALGRQIVRSGTSVAANYRAARRARSRKEFASKLGTVTEEADETALWLELVIESEQLDKSRIEPLLDEAQQLTKLFATTRRSAQKPKDTP